MIYVEAKKRIDWTKEEEDLLREHLRSGGGFSWESMRKLAKTLGRTVVAVRARLTKIRREEKEKKMRYKEFKVAIKAWGEKYGYETEVEIECIYVYVKTKFGMLFKRVARIRTDSTWALDTDWSSFTDIKEDARVELLSIILKLAKTPIKEREDEKRFIIPLPGLVTTDGKQQYLSQDYNFFASRRDRTLKQTWKEEDLKFVSEIYRQFAVEFDEGKEY